MIELIEILKNLHTSEGLIQLLQAGGLIAIIAIVFAETGLLAGFFLPGDSLLITAGILTVTNGIGGEPVFVLWHLLTFVTAAAVIGDQVGYALGFKTGDVVYSRPDSRFFKKKHAIAAKEFYEKHGPAALILARFVPIFRTFVPFVAGVGRMEYRQFVRYNVIGGVLWVFSMVLVGHFLGRTPLANQLHKIILVVIFVSILPIIWSAFQAWKNKKKSHQPA